MRTLTLIVIGIMLIGSLAWLVGQSSSDPADPSGPAAGADTGSDTGSDKSSQPASTISDVVPVWKEWPVPELALMITGEQHGYFEPCGCTANQTGGMARRADLQEKLKSAGWEVRGIDLGGLSRRTVRQAQIKYETSLQALRDLQYVAVGLGPEDLRMQPDFLITQDIPEEGEEGLRFVSANLVFFDSPELGTPVRSRILNSGGRRLGITSVMSESTKMDVIAEGTNSGITWSDPGPAIDQVLKEFDEQQVDVRILLSHSLPDESRQLARDYPQFDVIVMAQGFGDPDPTAEPEQIGNTHLIQTGHKGKYVGVLGIYPEDSETPMRYQLVPLERSAFADAPNMIDHMRSYQQRLLEEQIVVQDGTIGHPTGATFVGAATCVECHTQANDVWKETPHAHAFESLDPTFEREGYARLNGIPRMHDPECISCHVTGWDPQEYIRYRSGFLNKEFATTAEEEALHEKLAGNQCENCHGPGSRHVELIEGGDLDLARKEVRVSIEQVKAICYRCHDADNSPDFDFDRYWSDVEHYGLE